MPWIYFDRDELPAPSLKLPTLDGDNLEPDGEIIPQMLKFLESAALLCPE